MKNRLYPIEEERIFRIEDVFRILPEEKRCWCRQVSRSCRHILEAANQYELYQEDPLPLPLDEVQRAITYYDIGLAMLPRGLYDKTGAVQSIEENILRRHCRYGADLLDRYRASGQRPDQERVFWRLAAETALSHHERWDGKGYPFGQIATAIPLVCRIVAILDDYNNLVHGVFYPIALPHKDAILEVAKNSGTRFDPKLLKIFIKESEAIREIFTKEVSAHQG